MSRQRYIVDSIEISANAFAPTTVESNECGAVGARANSLINQGVLDSPRAHHGRDASVRPRGRALAGPSAMGNPIVMSALSVVATKLLSNRRR